MEPGPGEHHKLTIEPPVHTDGQDSQGAASPPAPSIPITVNEPEQPASPVWHMPDDSAPKTNAVDSSQPEAKSWEMPQANTASTFANTPVASVAVPEPPAFTSDPPISVSVAPVAVGVNSDVPPSFSPALPADPNEVRPVPVVRVLSPIGVEYVFMTIALFAGAIGLASVLLSLVNGKADFTVLAFPIATLLVSLPIFAYFFLRLKKLEYEQPSLKLDPSKRRSTQFTQITAFVVCLFTLIGLIYAIFAKMGGQSPLSIGKAIVDSLCILAVAGGILYYYWINEHRS